MLQHHHSLGGEPVVINVVETVEDLPAFRQFIADNYRALGVDSETTGLDIYGSKFKIRVAQFGNHNESWVIPVERGPAFESAVRQALADTRLMVLHNASFDLQVFEQTLGVKAETLWPKVYDTRIMAHLVDPRGREEGGNGHSLEDVTRLYVDEDVAHGVKTLMKNLAAEHHTTNANIWKKVPFDDPTYQLYSGMDPVLAVRVFRKLIPLLSHVSDTLVRYEHKVAQACTAMERTGFLVDVGYADALRVKLIERQQDWERVACDLGVQKVGSSAEVAKVFEGRGIPVLGRTPTGNPQVNEAFLAVLVEQGDELATAIVNAKRAKKWRTTWIDKFLAQRDGNDRCHASINPLRARTARMSITGIPAQTLPAGDSEVRSCFVADEGHSILSVDYQAQELRVLAALSGDATMIRAFQNDEDLHLLTARAAFGPHVTKDSPERKYAKVVNFGRVYGGGAKTVATQTGLDIQSAAKVVAGFDRAYPGVKKLAKQLSDEAAENGYITTYRFADGNGGGRRIPVDVDRAYSALNYQIQSTSREVTCRALIRLYDSGFGPYMRLPVHDEVLLSVPAAKADRAATEVARIMSERMGPVNISTEAKVGKRSWGSLYGADY